MLIDSNRINFGYFIQLIFAPDHFSLSPYHGCGGVSQDLWDNRELNEFGWDGCEYDSDGQIITQRELP